MAAKTVARKATKPRSAKRRAAKRTTRRAARKARRVARKTRRAARKARKPKSPKAAKKSTKPKAPKRKAARKTKKARRTVKPRKPKRVTKKMQTGSFRKVWNGTKKYTRGGLTKADLMMNKNRKIVSKKAHAHGRKLKSLVGWSNAVSQARKEMGITGFVLLNRGAQGTALYQKAREIYSASTPQ